MKKIVIQSILAILLVIGLLNIPAYAAVSQGMTMFVISVNLPVYSSFNQLSNYGSYTPIASLSYNTQVKVLNEMDYGAEIETTDGKIRGWIQKAYLSSDCKNQTWLVKQWRNLREDHTTSSPKKGIVPDGAKVYVLDYDKASKFYKIETTDGQIGWVKGTYQKDDGYDYGGGSNIIPYDFGKAGAVTNTLSVFTPLNTIANISADQINKFIDYKTNGAKTMMSGMGTAYIEAQKQSGLNAVYLLAHSGLESKWGMSAIVNNKYNFYGINAKDYTPMDAFDFSNQTNGIISGAKYISENYVNRDKSTGLNYPFAQPTLDNMRFNDGIHQYSTDEAWASKIASLVKEFNDFTFQKGWQLISGKWYYNNGDGTYKTGWVLDGGKWYYMNPSGAMQTGWKSINHKWYYFYNDGHMAANTKIGNYRLGKDGAMM